MSLEGILAGELLLAEIALEWLHLQVNSLVPLQVVISAKGLGALVTLEGTIERGRDALVCVMMLGVVTLGRHGGE
jgi:hypothetical protein